MNSKDTFQRTEWEIFMLTMRDFFTGSSSDNQMMKQALIAEITTHNNKITKARELLLNGDIEAEDYKIIKVKAEENIVSTEAKLSEMLGKKGEQFEIEQILYKALENLKKLDLMYLYATIEQRRIIIGSIFPEKMVFQEDAFRTAKKEH